VESGRSSAASPKTRRRDRPVDSSVDSPFYLPASAPAGGAPPRPSASGQQGHDNFSELAGQGPPDGTTSEKFPATGGATGKGDRTGDGKRDGEGGRGGEIGRGDGGDPTRGDAPTPASKPRDLGHSLAAP
jgi:hypothetical protein